MKREIETFKVGPPGDLDAMTGPVLPVIVYRDDAEAVSIANDPPYGLRAHLHGTDAARMKTLADQSDWGRVATNGTLHGPSLHSAVSSNRVSGGNTACSVWKRSWSQKP